MVRSGLTTDDQYILSIKNNEREAINALYAEHYGMVFKFVLNNSGTEHDAKDIYQEAVIILIKNIRKDTFRQGSSIKTYLYAICRRLWLKELQSRSRKEQVKLNDHEPFVDLSNQDHEDIREYEQKFLLMEKCLREIGEPCNTIIEDFYIHKRSMQDIADKMGYSNAENAKNQKYKCFKRLKKLVFKTGNYDVVQTEIN